MWTIAANEWKTALTAILKQLDNPQYDKMLEILQIPKQRKTAKFRDQLPQRIIEHHGLERSVRKIRDAMTQIPRNDDAVQNLLLPFVEQLKNEPKTEGKKRKRGECDSRSADKKLEVGSWKSFQPDKTVPARPVKTLAYLNLKEAALGGPPKPKKKKPSSSDPAPEATPKVQGAPVQIRRMEIKSVSAFNKNITRVKVEVKTEQEFNVSTQHLAEVLGYDMEDGVGDRISRAMPFSAEAKTRGNKITEMNVIIPAICTFTV